jgi:DNA transformation protein
VHDGFVDHCLELLAPAGNVRARRMFGGHGLYIDDLFVAIIAFERLYLKVDAGSQPRFAAAGCEPFVYDAKSRAVAMSYWSAPPEAMDSPALMAPWARLAVAAALQARALKMSSPSKARPGRAPATAAATSAATAKRAPMAKPPKRR